MASNSIYSRFRITLAVFLQLFESYLLLVYTALSQTESSSMKLLRGWMNGAAIDPVAELENGSKSGQPAV